jgi:predicted metalloprotease with PDZ domain
MFVPFIDRDELYLSEGLASYYQNVARAKTGMISPEQAWDKLLAGFGRGIRSAKRELLAKDPSTMQMYWGGAAIYLMADVALRERSKGKENLGSVLKRFNQCCQPSTSRWSGLRLMKKYDELSHSKIFTTLYQEQAQQRRFPDIMPVLKKLGFDGLKRVKGKPLSPAALDIMR